MVSGLCTQLCTTLFFLSSTRKTSLRIVAFVFSSFFLCHLFSFLREGVCAASLPTTMGITAGLLVQNALKSVGWAAENVHRGTTEEHTVPSSFFFPCFFPFFGGGRFSGRMFFFSCPSWLVALFFLVPTICFKQISPQLWYRERLSWIQCPFRLFPAVHNEAKPRLRAWGLLPRPIRV